MTRRVREHRYIIDTANPSGEITLVSPAEFAPPTGACDASLPRGTVILVHGLSDTAFAMRDLAEALSNRCYRARTLLLPGHGTVPGDLLAVNHDDWLDSVRGAIQQAHEESDEVFVIGFSLGAVLGLSLALEPGHPVDALVTISPAFHLSSWRLARWAPWFQRLRPWVDRELPDDRFRYEAMPTRGVAATRVLGLTHVAVHVSPGNAYYGIGGDYRNCGSTGGRNASSVALCEAASPDGFDYGLWDRAEDSDVPSARSTCNPRFDRLVDAIVEFFDFTGAAVRSRTTQPASLDASTDSGE